MRIMPIRAIKLFIAATLFVGAFRFALSVSGQPDSVVKYVSMTVIGVIGTVYCALVCKNWKQRLKSAYLLILPYMTVEVLALGYTLISRKPTIFHAPEYSFGTTPGLHFLGHLVGGVTWEPLGDFVVMQIIAFVAFCGRKVFKPAR